MKARVHRMLKVLAVIVFVGVVGVTAKAFKQQLSVEVNDVVEFKDCGSVDADIIQVDVTPCPELPCPFKKNTNIIVHVTFTAKENITSAKTEVHGIIAGVPVPFPLPKQDACLDMKCPIRKGMNATYTYVVPVKSDYPTIRLVVKWEVTDQNNKDLFCFEVPVIIKP